MNFYRVLELWGFLGELWVLPVFMVVSCPVDLGLAHLCLILLSAQLCRPCHVCPFTVSISLNQAVGIDVGEG